MSSNYLQAVRESLDLEPSEVALLWGVDPKVILDMEAGGWVPTREQCVILANLYGLARKRVLDHFYPTDLSENTNPNLPIQIPRAMYDLLKKRSAQTGVSVDRMVDKALQDYLSELERGNA